jgi:predicted AlkP superfamily phosphohydrolase/phosphomutase
LAERGTSGDVEALWPPYWSGAAWASILTGLPRDATGVHEDLAAIAPGLPPFQVPLLSSFTLNPMYSVRSILQSTGVIEFVPPPRALLRGKPVWQLLHEAGVHTAVIRFRFTYPPAEAADVIVSDWVGSSPWEDLGVRPRTTADAVAPENLAPELLAPFQTEVADSNLFARLLPGPLPDKPSDAILDPFAYLRDAADLDERTFQVSTAVLRRNPRQPFLAVYLEGLDSAEHAFWQYRFPEDFTSDPPLPEDVKRFGPVIDRYVQFLDERLKALIALYAQEPNVVIVSDHGNGRSEILEVWRGWHTKTGVFLAAGPSVPKMKGRIKVSYYDIVPTLASLKGFNKPSGLDGAALFRQNQALATKSNWR